MAKLEKGSIFPDMTVDAVLGRDVIEGTTISALRGGKPTMFWFLRYMGCTPCRLDVHLLTQKKPEFDRKGVNIMIVMQSRPEIVLRDMIDKSMAFPLICDPDQEIYRLLEIGSRKPDWKSEMTEENQAKMDYKKGLIAQLGIKHGEYEGNEEQRPAWFYVDSDGTVLEAHYGKYTYDMPLADEALAKIG
jgi:peroxiredoxin